MVRKDMNDDIICKRPWCNVLRELIRETTHIAILGTDGSRPKHANHADDNHRVACQLQAPQQCQSMKINQS